MADANSTKQELATQLEVIYIHNHPDRMASGMTACDLIRWGVRMGLISQQEAERANDELHHQSA